MRQSTTRIINYIITISPWIAAAVLIFVVTNKLKADIFIAGLAAILAILIKIAFTTLTAFTKR